MTRCGRYRSDAQAGKRTRKDSGAKTITFARIESREYRVLRTHNLLFERRNHRIN